MRALLDTCTLIWCLADPARLSPRVMDIASDLRNEIYVSPASLWEIATKHRIGRLPIVTPFVHRVEEVIPEVGFRELTVTLPDGALGGRMDGDHADPFDRFIAAQAILNAMPVLTPDEKFDSFPVARIWA